MKSREEYEASIYAKRDALIAKRKKKIQMTASALSVVICLGAAAVALPALSEKPDEAALPLATNAASKITENKIEESKAAFDEIGTYLSDFAVTKAQSNYPAFINESIAEKSVQNAEEIEYLTMSEIYRIPETEIALETEIAVEDAEGEYVTGDKQFAYIPSDALATGEEITKPSAPKKTYTTEEITAAAQKHLSDGDADKIIDNKTNSVVSRKSDGTTSYTVYFYTADKKITVKLSSSLELIEITEKDNAGGDTTQIAPAYNPNEQ